MASRIISDGHAGALVPHIPQPIITLISSWKTDPVGETYRSGDLPSSSSSVPIPSITIDRTIRPSKPIDAQYRLITSIPDESEDDDTDDTNTVRTTAHIPPSLVDHLDYCKSDYVMWIRGPNPPPAGVYRKYWNDDRSATTNYNAYPSTSQVTATTIPCPTTKPRKPYVCSAKHNAHNQRQKDAAAARAKEWYDARKDKVKTCYVCKKSKPMSEFKRVRNHGHYCGSGHCTASTDNPERAPAYENLCAMKGWLPRPRDMFDN